jgi:hypothetical protein
VTEVTWYLCSALNMALLHYDIFLEWRDRVEAADPDADTGGDSEESRFPDPERDWADAYVSALPELDIFFLKTSLGRVVSNEQWLSDRAKVVRMAACGAWRALQHVPPHQRDAGLGCLCAHLCKMADEDSYQTHFYMSVYYVAYNATHCCFECQRVMKVCIPTDVCTPTNARLAIIALHGFRAIAEFLLEQTQRWRRAIDATVMAIRDRGETDEQCIERYCRENGIPEEVPAFAFLPPPQNLLDILLATLGEAIDLRLETFTQEFSTLLWQGVAARDEQVVSVKVQSNHHHLAELNALWRIQGVRGVPRILDSLPVGTRHMLLVSDWLYPVQYAPLSENIVALEAFAQDVCGIVASIHELCVFHRVIDYRVFMRDGRSIGFWLHFSVSH